MQTKKLSYQRVATKWRNNPFPASRAINYLWPYNQPDYPGVQKGMLESLGKAITWQAVQHWVTGRRTFPVWAAAAIRDHIRRRCDTGLAICAELDAYIDAESKRVKRLHLPQAYPTRVRGPDE